MRKILFSLMTITFVLITVTSCIQEFEPQSSTVTADQAANAPGSYSNFVNAITSSLVGTFAYGNDSGTQYDYGYLPSTCSAFNGTGYGYCLFKLV